MVFELGIELSVRVEEVFPGLLRIASPGHKTANAIVLVDFTFLLVYPITPRVVVKGMSSSAGGAGVSFGRSAGEAPACSAASSL